jgi:SM-20-related protein
MPPHIVLHDFLEHRIAADLLDYTLSRENSFEPTSVGRSDSMKLNADSRVSLSTRELGPFNAILKSRILNVVSDIAGKLGTSAVDAPELEFELVAHNQGAFYSRHIDTDTTSQRRTLRVLSGVYYFHATPKAFSGGALRLFAIGNPAGSDGRNYVDVEPSHNSLLVFPSWAPHQVMPVNCPSGRFADSRFAVNCWVHRIRAAAPKSA